MGPVFIRKVVVKGLNGYGFLRVSVYILARDEQDLRLVQSQDGTVISVRCEKARQMFSTPC